MRARVRWLHAIGLTLGLLLGFVVGYTGDSRASRNSSGTYSLPSGNPVVTGTTISSSWANTTLSDLGSELTNSLDRSGRGAMLAPLKLPNGSVGAPSLTFDSDTDTGLSRGGPNILNAGVNGTLAQSWDTAGTSITNACSVAGATTLSGGATISGGSGNPALTVTGPSGQAAISATGGATSGRGITAVGTGTGVGGNFTGGSGNADGVRGFAGAGGASGVYGEAAASSGGAGVWGQAGTTSASGYGVVAIGTSGGAGLRASSSSTSVPVIKSEGYIDLDTASYPSSTTSIKDQLTPSNFVKVWGVLDVGAATTLVTRGFNITSVSCSSSVVTVTIGQDFLGISDYFVMAHCRGGGSSCAVGISYTSGGVFTLAESIGGVSQDLCATGTDIEFIALGIQ